MRAVHRQHNRVSGANSIEGARRARWVKKGLLPDDAAEQCSVRRVCDGLLNGVENIRTRRIGVLTKIQFGPNYIGFEMNMRIIDPRDD